MNSTVSTDIKDVRGNLLVPAQTDVIEWSKKHIFTSDYLKKKSKLKEVSFFVDDCQSIFEQKPYDKVLANWTTNFREWIGEIWAPSQVFEELRLLKSLDPYSYKHSIVIAVVGSRLLEIWVKSAPTVKRSFQALVFHRLGKTRMAEGLLKKEGELDQLERQAILEQPLVGFVLNACYWGGANNLCAKVALQQQEDRLGKGYPQGVATNSLLLDILHCLDRFDALISERPFRYKKFTVRQALDILKQDAEEGRMEVDVLRALTDLIREEKLKDYKKLKFGTVGRES